LKLSRLKLRRHTTLPLANPPQSSQLTKRWYKQRAQGGGSGRLDACVVPTASRREYSNVFTRPTEILELSGIEKLKITQIPDVGTYSDAAAARSTASERGIRDDSRRLDSPERTVTITIIQPVILRSSSRVGAFVLLAAAYSNFIQRYVFEFGVNIYANLRENFIGSGTMPV
ncbi:hypothetical protein U1Q18_052197, partial [Sarracenia purpurea var. burkii]